MSDTEGVAPKKKRSKNGCECCRLRRIKCDEKLPACGRCLRLGLECTKPSPRLSLQRRRQGLGSIKNRRSWRPQNIAPLVDDSLGLPVDPIGHQNATGFSTDSLSDRPSVVQAVHDSASSTDDVVTPTSPDAPTTAWPLIEALDPDNLPVSSNDVALTCVGGNWQGSFPPTAATSATYLPDTSLPLYAPQELASTSINPASDGVLPLDPMQSGTVPFYFPLSNPLSTLAWPSTMDFPCVTTFQYSERRALDYYRTVFAPSRTVKGFDCSFYFLVLRIASIQESVLHFILALSLHGLNQIGGDSSLPSPRTYLNKGLQCLSQCLADGPHNTEECNHILVAFWLLMVYSLECESPAESRIQRGWLRQAMVGFFHKHYDPQKLNTNTSSLGNVNSGGSFGNATQSLMAKLMCSLIVAEVQLDFRTYNGQLAEEFCDNNSYKYYQLWQQGESCLQLTYGSSYPIQELLYDIESSGYGANFIEQLRLHHSINKLFWTGIGNYDVLKGELDSLEKRCSAIFNAANTPFENPDADYPRLRFLVDNSVSEFHALRIYHFRCRDQEPTESIRAAVSTYLQIKHRMQRASVRYTSFDRSLFIVGIEVDDSIRRDWILQHIITPELKQTLIAVWTAQRVSRRRLRGEELRNILRSQISEGSTRSFT